MSKLRRITALMLALIMMMTLTVPMSFAKTNNSKQTVGSVLFYITNSSGEQVLVSQIPISTMVNDLKSGVISNTVHNYSLLDSYVTTVHQECQGFTVPEFINYAKGKSTASNLNSLAMTFSGSDKIAFWEIDQTNYDKMDTYTYDTLYGTERYNFPKLYQYFNYDTQELYDPAGSKTKEQVMDYLMQTAQREQFILGVYCFSQRYIETEAKRLSMDFDMENYWSNSGLLDSTRSLRMMIPMSESELRSGSSSVSNSRYWVARICLSMQSAPNVSALGKVSAPTATMTEDDSNYYVRFSCDTQGASIYYNGNYSSTEYAPAELYRGSAVKLSKEDFPEGFVTITAQAVKDGYTDAGVQTLNLKPTGTETEAQSGSDFSDVTNDSWYAAAVKYVNDNKLFDAVSTGQFAPESDMTREMLAIALYRLQGSPQMSGNVKFTDVAKGTECAKAVEWANANSVVYGKSDTSFAPYDNIKRQEIAAMMYRYAKLTGTDITASGDLTVFTDSGSISSWAVENMKWAVGNKYINGMGNGTVNPMGTATRAQVAQILLNYNTNTSK